MARMNDKTLMNQSAPDRKAPSSRAAWVYGLILPLAYLVVELSFCNQLIQTMGDHSPDDVLTGFEFWGRVISGFGLGILIHRLLSPHLSLRGVGFFLSITAGIAIMWNVQKTLIEYLVEAASPQDKQAALALVWVAPNLGNSLLKTLSGQDLVVSEPQGIEKNIAVSLSPAAALHAEQRQQQFAQWLVTTGTLAVASNTPTGDTSELEKKAYRALIVAPLVIGLSLLFAMLNFALAVSFVLCTSRPRWRAFVAAALLCLFAAITLNSQNLLLDSEGYQRSLRPHLWKESPTLALSVEWSARAATQWAPASELAHRYLLLGYRFGSVVTPR